MRVFEEESATRRYFAIAESIEFIPEGRDGIIFKRSRINDQRSNTISTNLLIVRALLLGCVQAAEVVHLVVVAAHGLGVGL